MHICIDTSDILFVQVLEFGTGDGGPVIASLVGSGFQGTVHGFDINEHVTRIARKRAADSGLQSSYQVAEHSPYPAQI